MKLSLKIKIKFCYYYKRFIELVLNKDILSKFCKISRNYYYRNPSNFEKIMNGGNEIRDSKKEGKYKIISFADKHMKRMFNMYRFKQKIKRYEIIDYVKVFNLSDIAKKFKKENKALFLDKRIFPWIAKAYLINKLIEDSDYGDVIFWIDSDIREIAEDGIQNLFNLCNNSEKGLVGFHSEFWLERSFTKIDLINYFKINDQSYLDSTQAYGSIFLLKKNEFTINFFKQFLEICCMHNLMDYSPSIEKESEHFIIHQNDQSILSLLFKINNIKTFPIPFYDLCKTNIIALHSGYFSEGINLPITWEPCWHNLSYVDMWNNCNKKYNKAISPSDCLSISTDYFS